MQVIRPVLQLYSSSTSKAKMLRFKRVEQRLTPQYVELVRHPLDEPSTSNRTSPTPIYASHRLRLAALKTQSAFTTSIKS
jgi:hypothetical protein